MSDFDKRGLSRLKGRVAFITGAARPRGIGFSIAKLFSEEDAIVIIADIADQVLDSVKSLQEAGHSAMGFQVDLTRAHEVEEIVEKISNRFGRIDILCNAAGKSVPPRPSFQEMTEEYWNTVMDRNLKTTFLCCKAVLPKMINNKYGRIINISSITGPKVVYRYSAAYAASKGAVSALTKALALELGKYNITVNAILPGSIDTADSPWTPNLGRWDLGIYSDHLDSPIPRPGTSEEVAALSLFLASSDSRFITGAEIVIDGGATIVEPYAAGPS
jgi:NAD(P)-dependent dehydrogenase (short-subunit alcohol dehydrogenase family)